MSLCDKGKIIKKCFIARWTGCPNCNNYLNKNGEPKSILVGNEKELNKSFREIQQHHK